MLRKTDSSVSVKFLTQAFNILVRNGLSYKKQYDFLKKSQWWDANQLERYQLGQLSKLLNHAYTNVPYYTRVFDERGLKPKDLQTIKDLEQLPFLTKDMVRKNLKDLCAKNYSPNKFESANTGGSSGTPLELYFERGITNAKEWAFMKTQWDRVGYRFRDKCAVFGAFKVRTLDNIFWEPKLFGRWMLFSSYDISNQNILSYTTKLKKYNPKFIHGFPSTISLLAKNMSECNIQNVVNLKGILCGSEILFPSTRKLLETTFNTRVYSWYGLTEKVVLAGECEVSNYYHIFPEYGITELIDENGKAISSGTGEIVGTGFNNYAMPLIRYKTGDIGVLSTKKCDCGREYPLLEIVEGRSQDFVITRTGSKISLIALIGLIFDCQSFSNIREFQLVQEEKGELIFNIVKNNNFSKDNEKEILNIIEEASHSEFEIIFNYLDVITKTERGKHKLLIQKLATN